MAEQYNCFLRKYLKQGNRGGRIPVNMEEAYIMLDSGKTVQEVATYFGVSRTTLYKRHREYQDRLAHELEGDGESFPPIPEDL